MIHKTKELNAVIIGGDKNKILDVNGDVAVDYTKQILDFIKGYGIAEVAPLMAAMRFCVFALKSVLENKTDKKFAEETLGASIELCEWLKHS